VGDSAAEGRRIGPSAEIGPGYRNGDESAHGISPGPAVTYGALLAIRFIESTGKSTIGGPYKQIQFDLFVGFARKIRASRPNPSFRYNRQSRATNMAGGSPARHIHSSEFTPFPPEQTEQA
jgi:hypothetical protein